MDGPNDIADDRPGIQAAVLPPGRGMAAIAGGGRLRQRDGPADRGNSLRQCADDCEAAVRPLLLRNFTATSCIGKGVAATLESLLEQRSGLASCKFETVDIATHVGEVAGVDEERLPDNLRAFDCRNNRLAELALHQDGFFEAVQQAASRIGRRRVGVFLGTSTAGILQTELAYRERDPVSGALPASCEYGSTHNSFSVADYLRRRCRLEGPAVAVSCACASSAKAFGSARRMLEAGLIDAALVGGVDSLCLTTLYGFHSLQLSSPVPCRPFDVARDGISIGEAAAFALLERAPDDLDGDSGLLLGIGESSDAYHMSEPPPHGLRGRRARVRRHRLHQSARYRNAQQRSVREPGGHRCIRPDHPLQFDQGRDGSYPGRGRGAGGGHQRPCRQEWVHAGRDSHEHHRSDAHGSLYKGQSPRSARARAVQFIWIRRHELQPDIWSSRMRISAYLGGLGVLGPGLANWPEAAAVLSGQAAYRPAATGLALPVILAFAEP